MKKLLVVLVAVSFVVVSCNNNKNDKNLNLNNRDKDDYGKNENANNGNNNNTDNNSTGWTENDKSTFLKECAASFDESQASLANRICPCVLEKMEKEFSSYSEANSKGGEAAGERIALQCKEEIVGNNDNNNTTGNWSKSDEQQWMNACKPSLVASLGEQRATNYCSCVLDKMKEMYSSFQEANTKGTTEMGTELGKKCIKELGIGE